jgi:hypothetical protein
MSGQTPSQEKLQRHKGLALLNRTKRLQNHASFRGKLQNKTDSSGRFLARSVPGAFAQMFSAVDRRHTDAEIRAEAICDAMAGRGR